MGCAASDQSTFVGANQQNPEEAERSANARKSALERFQKIMLGQLILGAGLLTCGILGIAHYDSAAFFGPPYFIGGMVAGPLLLLGFLSSFMLRRHAANYTESDTAKGQARCDMQGIQITTMFTFMGCFMGFVMLGISGVLSSDRDCFSCEEDKHRSTNKTLAIVLVILLVLTFLFAIFIMYSFCTTAHAFGVVVQNRRAMMVRQQQILMTQMAMNQQMMNQQMNTGGNMFGNTGNTQAMTDLQRQNMLLQQQIQMMQQQQQQQQPAYPPTGFSQPPPPPSYDTVAGSYPPAPAYSGFNQPSAPTDFGGGFNNSSATTEFGGSNIAGSDFK